MNESSSFGDEIYVSSDGRCTTSFRSFLIENNEQLYIEYLRDVYIDSLSEKNSSFSVWSI